MLQDGSMFGDKPVFRPMMFGRVGFLGLTKLNLASVAKKPNVTTGELSEAVKPFAYAMALVTNNMDRVSEIIQSLEEKSKNVDFYKKVFELVLPAISTVDYGMIVKAFESEAEVLRSL